MTLSLRFPLVFGIVVCSLWGQSNETIVENSNPGTTNWQLTNPALNREIEGYASLTSVNVGGAIDLFVSTAAPTYTIDVFRLGWYGGTGARQLVTTVSRSGFLQTTPVADSFGRFECNWTSPYVLTIPANWVSGIYLVKLTASTGSQSYIQFVVREDARHSALLFQRSAGTDNAYNNWPGLAAKGKSLYTFNSDAGVAAVKVSFNRPYFIDDDSHYATHVGAGFLLRWEVNLLRWLEKTGYDVTYCTDIDKHENSSLLLTHKGFLSVGHDEYWSWEMRTNVEAARDSGVNLAFLSPNVSYWQTRMETSPISGALDRTIVSYKETARAGLYGATKTNDPTTDPCRITTNWRYSTCKFSEQNFVGVEFIEGSVGCPSSGTCVDMVIADASSWALSGTGLVNGSHIPGLLGYEVDGVLENDSPAGVAVIAKSPIPVLSADAQTHPFSEVVTYTATSGATVFSVGTMQWSWGLDDWGATSQRPSLLSPAVQTITQNVLGRFGAAVISGPDLTITKSHAGNFTPGQTAATYTLTATNSGSGATSGTVSVTDTVPTGLTATAIAGTGWTCTQPAGPCTRTDALAAGASYPAIALTVKVASNAPASVTNTATVAGGGETNTSNDTFSDPTTIGVTAGPPVTDTFNTPSLNTSVWTFVNPVGNGSFSMTGTQLKLTVPVGSNHDAAFGGTDNTAHVVQSIANADFIVTTKFDSIPTQQYQFEGVVVDQDAANYLRIQFGSNGSSLAVSGDKILANTQIGLFSNAISLPAGTTSLWLRIQKTGSAWTATWSPDGASFNTGGSFTQALTVADIGPFSGNYNPTVSASPAFSALVDSFVSGSTPTVPDLTITKSHTGNFTQGQTGASYTITATNSGGAATSGTVTVTDTLPTGLTATAIAGTGWTCTSPAGPCTRADVLAAGASYPAITLTVTVASNAPTSVTNTATIAGGGETTTSNDTATNPTTIVASSTPDLTITKSHTGNFTQGQTGATYTITATNSGSGPTTGTVTVTDTLPTGLTATAIAGTGWTCTSPAGPCTRADVLAAGASYPAITLTVTVASNAPTSVTNTATIAGGGETNTSNDTASDATTVGGTSGAPVTDNFNTPSLNTSLWTFVNPVGNGSSSMTGTQLNLNVPAGSNHDAAFGGTDSAARVVQSISNADFSVTVKFDSIPAQQYQFEGIVVDQDAANFLRLQFGSNGSSLAVSGDKILANTQIGLFSNTITPPTGTTSLWLRVQRAGTTWTVTWSPDGATFNAAGSFTQALTAIDIGPFSGNYNPTTSASPAFAALVDSFVSGAVAAVPDLTITKSHTGNFTQGQTGATYTITATNSGGAATSGTVTVTDTVPTGLTATVIAGTGWTCTSPAGPCTRADVLAAGASYPAITLTVTVASNAPASVTNTATIAGGGETTTSNDTATNPTTIVASSTPDLTITKSHTGNFTQGQTGATYTITATNSGSGPTSGTVTVTDTLPTGLTATAIAGTGWTCTSPAGPCTRADVLAAGASYPAITLTVTVASNAPASVTNTATIAGGGETTTSNDTATNPTTITASSTPDLTITKSHTGNFTQGQTGATYTITATNSGSGPTSGTVTLTDTLPTGLTATAIAGTGWTCTSPAGPCTRADVLAAGASYPAITLTVTVASNAPTSVTNTATIAGGGETNTSNDTASDATTVGGTSGAPVTDNFNTPSLNTSLWTFVNPVGNGSSSMTGTQLNLNVPAGSNHDAAFGGTDSAARVVQSISNADFIVTTKFDSIPAQQYQFEGIVVDQDAANFLRLQFGSNGSSLAVSGDKILANTQIGLFSNTITPPTGTTSLWLRVQRAGTTWTVTWSPDGATFNAAGSFTQALTAIDIGPFSGNYNPTTSASPAFAALVDSFVSGAVAAVPDLTITKSHTGNFTQGQTGATYTITATNSGGAATSGTVTVTDTVPTGLTATAIAGTGWTCTSPAGPCTRADVLAAGASYPAITLTVSVASNAPASVTNTATIAGGGETTTSNDTASDATTIGGTAGAPVTDNFNTPSLNTSLWTFVNPLADGTFSMTGTQLKINAPTGANHDAAFGGVDNAPRVVQSIANADFTATVKFDSIPTLQYQFEGAVVDQDAANFLRFQFGSNGSSLDLGADKVLSNAVTGLFSTPVSLPGGTTSVWIKLQRSGTTWTVTWSSDGVTFNSGGSFTQALTVTDIGLFAGNYNGTASAAPAFSALVDSFVSGTVAAVPDLTITKSHLGNFTLGQAGAIYTITATNSGGAATSGSVTVTDTLPTGLTATAITGTGWTCTQPAGPCTRADILAAAASYPAITLTVSVAGNAPASVTNTVTVAGGSETVTSNDTASDQTTLQGASGSLVSDDFTSGSVNTAVWTAFNPKNDGSITQNGNSLVITVPAGVNHDVWTDGENGVRIMQSAADADFEVEVKFSSVLNKNTPFQQQGILVEQDSTNFLRLCQYSDNQRILLFLASISGSTASIVVSEEMRGGAATWMRVKRTGNNWLFSYSYDSLHWTPFAFTKALHVTKVGPYAGNSQFNGGSAPALTAVVDHFVNRAAPLSTIDGAAYPPPAAPPVINVWYGDSQTFGHPGIPQQWVNILGDVSDFDQVTTLTYSINGGAEQPLSMGENLVRLVAPGNFNVEIDYAALLLGSNTVRITATDTLLRKTIHTVNVTIASGQTWPSTYSINWNTAPNIQSVSQIVDGQWQIQSGAVKVIETGYDRLIALGDRTTWTNFVVTAEVTMNSLDTFGFAVAIIAGWQGHTTLQYGVPLTDQPRTGHPFPAFGGYAFGLPGPPAEMIYENTPSVPESVIAQKLTTLQTGVKYIFKFQANQNTSGGSHYSFKAWLASATEPGAWDVEGDGELSKGSLVLAAHRADVSFGAVTVTGQ